MIDRFEQTARVYFLEPQDLMRVAVGDRACLACECPLHEGKAVTPSQSYF